jgi:EPS-associated MarR family transcriptional regulator
MKTPSEENSFRLLWSLERQPSFSQRDLAAHIGLSLGAVNYCLKALVVKGYIKVENVRSSDNQSKYFYVLTPQGIQKRIALTGRFLKRKRDEYYILQAEIAELEAELDAEVNQPRKVTADRML